MAVIDAEALKSHYIFFIFRLISDIELVNGDIIIFQCVDDDDDDDDENDSSEWADLLLSSNSESEDTRGADEESSPTDTPPHLTKR